MIRLPRCVSPSRTGLVLVLALLAAGCASGGTAEVAESPYRNATQAVDFVGDASCASCHEALYTSYQTHGMANSFYRMTPERAVEDFSGVVVTHPASRFSYTVYRDGDRFVQEEFRVGPSGEKTHRLVRAMDFVVGSGSAARTYLAQVEGQLFELPLTWYTQNGGKWDLSPGYEVVNARFDRAVPSRCMACHNGYSEPVEGVEGQYASLADGIGCESCHGPGALHVDERTEDPEGAGEIDDTIVNPAHLSLERRLDVCQQCHLHAEVSILRDGQTAFGYRPSTPLSAHRALFAPADEDPSHVNVISQADRMKASACFVESRSMDCVTCHNPHEGFRDKGPDYFNATCRTCHDAAPLQAAMPTPALRQQHAPAADCVSCHMPKVEVEDAPHASFTDHKIRVVRDDRVTGTAGASGDLVPYFDEDEDEGPMQGMAYVVYGRQAGGPAAVRRGVSILGKTLEGSAGPGEAQYLLGFAQLQMGQPQRALPALRAAVALGESPERLNTLAQAVEGAGGPPAEAEALYRRALTLQPAAATVRTNLGRLLEAQGRLGEAVAEYRRAIAARPWLAAAHTLLGGALAKGGDLDGAVGALRDATRLEPDDADALTNLAVLLAQRGQVAEAGPLFQRAVAADPRNANAQANLALYWLNVGRTQDAAARAQDALRLNPQQGTALQVVQALRSGGA